MPKQKTTSAAQLKLLWDLLPHMSPEHVVRCYARYKDGSGRTGDYARTLGELRQFVKSQKDKNIYVAPNPTMQKVGARHSTKDVTHWSYVLVDVDPVVNALEPNALNALEMALIWLGTWWDLDFTEGSPQRPLVIDSGRGAQAWIRLEDWPLGDVTEGSLGSNTVARKDARKAMGYWLNRVAQAVGTNAECQVDVSTSDLPRLMRCPGTRNAKTHKLAKIIHPGPSAPYEGLVQKILERTPETVYAEPDVSEVIKGRTWQAAFPELTRTAQEYLLRGMEEGGRHKAVFSTARKLCEVGVSLGQARKGILRANKLRGKEHELHPDEIESALRTAYNRD